MVATRADTLPLVQEPVMIPSDLEDADYTRLRETAERVAAAGSTDLSVRDAHLGMAERYADRALVEESQQLEKVAPDSLIDQVAAAICGAASWRSSSESQKAMFRTGAHDAFAAARKPTQAMEDAGRAAVRGGSATGWEAMIDAMLG